MQTIYERQQVVQYYQRSYTEIGSKCRRSTKDNRLYMYSTIRGLRQKKEANADDLRKTTGCTCTVLSEVLDRNRKQMQTIYERQQVVQYYQRS